MNKCVVCGSEWIHTCYYCESPYCTKHYATTVMTGNCCRENEKDYE